MQFMVSVTVSPEKDRGSRPKELVEAEFEAVRGHYMDGLLRQIWVRADGGGAIILAEGESAEAVSAQFSALPMVRAGFLLAPDVVELAPYYGFAPRG
jgi:hypothetical protein